MCSPQDSLRVPWGAGSEFRTLGDIRAQLYTNKRVMPEIPIDLLREEDEQKFGMQAREPQRAPACSVAATDHLSLFRTESSSA